MATKVGSFEELGETLSSGDTEKLEPEKPSTQICSSVPERTWREILFIIAMPGLLFFLMPVAIFLGESDLWVEQVGNGFYD